jgi:choline dehydrogenase-like flavoprotein
VSISPARAPTCSTIPTSITWAAAREVGLEADQFWEVALFAATERGPVMAHVGTAPFVPPGYPLPAQGLTITPNVALSCSVGRVGLRSSDPVELPRVDPAWLRARGVTGLRVADASIFPTLPGVNPCLTCMMAGERAAEIIAAELAGDVAVGGR